MQLSACIITKNEQENLEQCLKALSVTGMELVVVDTGSTDGTRKMAAQYTDSIYDFAWCDDFAAAKNYAVSMAAHDMVMVIDSDEFMTRIDMEELQGQIRQYPDKVGRILRVNTFSRQGEEQENQEYINRIFDRRCYHYEGRIHEQITALDGTQNYATYQTSVTIRHAGYDGTPEQIRCKADRNIRLLTQELALHPDDTYLIYQLGKSYYMAGDYEQAVVYLGHGLEYDVNPKLEYVIDMVETYGYALLNTGKASVALQFEGIYEEFKGTADFQFLMGLIYMNNELFDKAVEEFMKAARHDTARTTGANSYLAYYNAGVILECLGDVDGAVEYYRQCGDYKKAKERVRQILEV